MSRSEVEVSVVLSTAPNAEVGARIARTLVEESLAACVNLLPGVRSIYRWQGEVCDEAEVLLLAKVATARALQPVPCVPVTVAGKWLLCVTA